MRIRYEQRLDEFEFWCGAKYTAKLLKPYEFELIENYLDDIYPEGIDETILNDFFWFDEEIIADILGYEDFESLYNERQDRL